MTETKTPYSDAIAELTANLKEGDQLTDYQSTQYWRLLHQEEGYLTRVAEERAEVRALVEAGNLLGQAIYLATPGSSDGLNRQFLKAKHEAGEAWGAALRPFQADSEVE